MIKLEKLEKGEFFKDAFLVSYRYNKDYLNKMRSLKYKRYVPDKKAWEIPSSELKHLVVWECLELLVLIQRKRQKKMKR